MSISEEKVRAYFADRLSVTADQLMPEARFVEDLGADSLDSVELVMGLEEEFGVSIPDEDAEKLTTYGKVLSYLKVMH